MSATIGSWWLSSTEALAGEEVLFSKAANHTQSSGRAVGGKLFVTNHRILFLPHLADAALAGRKWQVALDQIRDIGHQPAGGDTLGGGLRDRLMIQHSAGTDLFVVSQLPKVIATLRPLCLAPAHHGSHPAGLADPARAAIGADAFGGPTGTPTFSSAAPAAAGSSRRERWIRIGVIGAVAAGITGFNVYRDVHTGGDFRPVVHDAQVADTTCPVAGAQTLTMTKNSPEEPAIHIPVRPGWQEHDFRNDPKIQAKDPDAVSYLRGTIINMDLRDNGYTPGIEAVLEKTTDTATSPQNIADTAFYALEQTAANVTRSTQTICGTTIYRADYTGLKVDAHTSESGTSLVTVTNAAGGVRWLAGAKLSTSDPADPDYIAERDALLQGFHVSNT